MIRSLLFSGLVILVMLRLHPAAAYPVIVHSCGDTVTFDGPPQRPVVNDLNMVQTVIDLGLIDRFVGVTGIAGVEAHLQAPPATIAAIRAREFSDRYPGIEAILGQAADFYFAGWGFGLSQAGVTPAALADVGIKTYALAESCIKLGPRAPVSMDTVYADILVLGAIFDVMPRAKSMVADFAARVAAITARTDRTTDRPTVMYCGDCDSDAPPLSMGGEGVLNLLIELAGGRNIFSDIRDSYVRVSWEAVIARDPAWIIISDHRIPTGRIVGYLTSSPALANLAAVRLRHFLFMSYAERSPSTRNVQALERLAPALHPNLFAP